VPADDSNGVGQLCVASLAAPKRKPEVVVSNEDGEVQCGGWTRDGASIIYWRAGEFSASLWADGVPLYSVGAEGGIERSLGVETLANADSVNLAPQAAGNLLAVTKGFGRETWEEQRIGVVNLDDGSYRGLTGEDTAALCPAWSPDGHRIAYMAGPDGEATYAKSMKGVNIRVMRPDGTIETKQVAPEMHLGPGGGEEAHLFLQQRKIWLVEPSGTAQPRQLTGDPRYRDEEPLWSADGGHILFGRMKYDGHASLWMMESRGADLDQVSKLQIFAPFGDDNDWFGDYGYIDWRDAFHWRTAPSR
jgi:Tol biopolymer transport system component